MRNLFCLFIALIILLPCIIRSQEKNSSTGYTKEQQFLFDTFNSRRSVRQYLSTPIPKEHIVKMIEMAKTAPSAGNQQPWKFMVIQDRAKLDELKTACAVNIVEYYKTQKKMTDDDEKNLKAKAEENLSGYLSAPVYIIVLSDTTSQYPTYNIKDVTMAAGYLLIAARALGYGSVFCTDSFPFDIVKKVFSIPDKYEVICTIPVGVPVKWSDAKSKKSVDDVTIFEKF